MTSDINNLNPISLAEEADFRLGNVEVRPSTRELRGPFGREVLEPRVMQVLVALARRRGETVSRDQLIVTCWEGRVVSEDAINRVLSRLRRLAEATGGWDLETITKVGYRLAVSAVDDGLVAAPAGRPAASPSRRAWLAGGGALLATAGAVAGWRFLSRAGNTASPQARDFYERGRAALLESSDTTSGSRAVGLLREAVATDPTFAAAWGSLALAYQISLGDTPRADRPAVEARARAAAQRALSLDPREVDARAALALLTPSFRNWAQAEHALDAVLATSAQHGPLQVSRALLMGDVGRIAEGVRSAEIAAASDPFSPFFRYVLGVSYWTAGRLEEAERSFDLGLERWPRYYAIWFPRFWMLVYSGRSSDAMDMVQRTAERPSGIPDADFDLLTVAARACESRSPADIDAATRAHSEAALRGSGYAANAMEVAAFLGRLDTAFAIAGALFLGNGFRTGDSRFSRTQGEYTSNAFLRSSKLFGPPTTLMRADPRFSQLCRDLGLEAYWVTSGHQPDFRARR